jgi:glycosyltransferase involved in cell wall biosynthesis
MKVLLILPSLLGGAARVGVELATELEHRGVRTDIFLSLGDGNLVDEARERGIKVFSYRKGTTVGALQASWLFAVALVRLTRLARRYDVLVAGNDAADHLLALLAGRIARRPVTGVFQVTPSQHLKGLSGAKLKLMRLAMTWASPRLDLLICISKGVRDDAVALGVAPQNTIVVTPGLALERISRLAKDEDPAPMAERVVLGVGRLSREKGFDLLLRAHALARVEAPHRLVLIGEGPERSALEALVHELDIADTVSVLGFQPNPYPQIALAELVCVPSRHEGLSLVVREALVLGTPVLAADCPGGIRQSLAGGRYGGLVEAENPGDLASAIVAHLQNPSSLQQKMRVAQRELATCTTADMASRYLEAMWDLLERRPSSLPSRLLK